MRDTTMDVGKNATSEGCADSICMEIVVSKKNKE